MFTALMSLALVAIVVAAAVQYSQAMDEMLSHGASASGKPAARSPDAGIAPLLAAAAG